MKQETIIKAREKACGILDQAGIAITEKEKEEMEIADLGLDDIENIGIEVIEYINNNRYCAKELILFPNQICPEHRHPFVSNQNPGKMETFRCRWGQVFLYVEGESVKEPKANVSERYKQHLNVWHEIILNPGEQYTIPPNGLHWFQAGEMGAVVSEFSSSSTDENDVFTDPNIKRVTGEK